MKPVHARVVVSTHQLLLLTDAVATDVQHFQEGEEGGHVSQSGEGIPSHVQLLQGLEGRQPLQRLQPTTLQGQHLRVREGLASTTVGVEQELTCKEGNSFKLSNVVRGFPDRSSSSS